MAHSALKTALVAVVSCMLSVAAWADPANTDGAFSPQQLQSAVERLEKLAEQTLASSGVPGIAVAVVHGDEVILKRGFGLRAAGKPGTIDADTVFQMASVSKPISSTLMALLVGEGQIGWDDRVTDHDPSFEMYHPFVTHELRLRDLLCHRSGLPDHAGDLLEDLGYDKTEVLRRLRYLPPDSSFRAGYAYTNTGYSEACYAAAKALGSDWSELAKEKLFRPLGMNHTSYQFADYQNAPNRALLHVKVDGKWTPKYTRRPDVQAPAGGVSTTLNDLTQWLRLQVGEGEFEGQQLVDAAALAETHQPQYVFGIDPATGRLSSYGLGWNVSIERGGRAFYKHSGEFALGMRTEVAILPSEHLAIAVLSNAAPSGIPEALTESFFDWLLDGKLQRDWVAFANQKVAEQKAADRAKETDYSHPPKSPNPSLALSAYTGKYANEFFGAIELVEKDGKLVLRAGPEPLEFVLTHWDRDVFIYQPTGEMSGGLSGVLFTVGGGAKADRLLIENLNVHGQGEFKRGD